MSIDEELSKLERLYSQEGGTLADRDRFRLRMLLKDLKEAMQRHPENERRVVEYLRRLGWELDVADLAAGDPVRNARRVKRLHYFRRFGAVQAGATGI